MSKRALLFLIITLILCALLTSCFAWNLLSADKASKKVSDSREMKATGQDTVTQEGEEMYQDTSKDVVYLAGGCFWGLEALMQSIPGVIDAESGYANGTCEADANYRSVCTGNTGFRETVRVAYDPQKVSLDALLLAYFYVIDPTVKDRQGNDRGSQYQTGIYYTNDKVKETVERIAEIERQRSEKFFVEIAPLRNYYPAEAYHQDYLKKNPNGYCHIPKEEMKLFSDNSFQIIGKSLHLLTGKTLKKEVLDLPKIPVADLNGFFPFFRDHHPVHPVVQFITGSADMP